MWLNNNVDKSNLEKQILKFALEIFEHTNSVFSCICEWPNDADFLEESFANFTDVIISEFKPRLICSNDYSKVQWLKEVKAIRQNIEIKYGVMSN